ncbi:MAG: hypothetical protein ACEQSK_19040 [Sphingomonadaceae bacterium]
MRTIHRNFQQITDAESARSALLADGFRLNSVKLNTHHAAASSTATSAVTNVFDRLVPGGAEAAARARKRAGAMLTIDIDDDDQEAQANSILQRYGATEI